jgi:hypothetical protein
MNLKYEDILKLGQGIQHMEASVKSAKATLSKQPNYRKDLMARLDSYDESVATQKVLLEGLIRAFLEGNEAEVANLVIRINAVSQLVAQDAREARESIQNPKAPPVPKEEWN